MFLCAPLGYGLNRAEQGQGEPRYRLHPPPSGGSALRLVYLITSSEPGGAQVHVRDLAVALLRAGHEPVVLVGGRGRGKTGPGDLVEELRAAGVPVQLLRHLVRPLHPRHDLLALREIRTALARLRPDLLSTHSSKAGWLGRLAGRWCRLPTLFTAHGWAFTEGVPLPGRALYLWAERLVAPLAARIVTVSDYDRELALRLGVGRPGQVVTIHNGMPDVPPSLRAAPQRHPPRIVMVARFSRQKDQPALLRALAGLSHLDWSLDLIGDGPERPQAERLTRELRLESRVRFLGTRRDVSECLAAAQLFVLTSNWEGLPRSIIEAQRAGLPVVATRVGGVPELVVHGETGLLVPHGDIAALRAALASLLQAAPLRLRLGESGRRRYEARFTFERMLRETLGLYKAVLRGAAPATARRWSPRRIMEDLRAGRREH